MSEENTTEQYNINVGIGDKEPEKHKPAELTIASVRIGAVGEKKKAKKVFFSCIHPDKPDEPIEISKVKYEVKSQLKISATWYNLEKKDKETDPDKLQKNSAVAHIMRFLGVNILSDIVGHKINSTPDENGYLVLKAY